MTRLHDPADAMLSATPAEPRIGFVGLGVMGAAMVERMLDRGFEVAVFNRTRASADVLVEKGATLLDSAAELASSSDLVLSCLLDTTAIGHVHGSAGGVIDHMQPGSTLVEHGTFSPRLAVELWHRARDRGVDFLDLPVTGGPEGAREGTLTGMAGGELAALDRVRPVIEAYVGRIEWLGAAGSGLRLKLVNQLLVTTHLAAAAEASALVQRLGLLPEPAQRVLDSGWAGSAMLARSMPRSLSARYESTGATVEGLSEVQRLVNALAEDSDLDLSVFAAAQELFAAACDMGIGHEDPAALLKTVTRTPRAFGV